MFFSTKTACAFSQCRLSNTLHSFLHPSWVDVTVELENNLGQDTGQRSSNCFLFLRGVQCCFARGCLGGNSSRVGLTQIKQTSQVLLKLLHFWQKLSAVRSGLAAFLKVLCDAYGGCMFRLMLLVTSGVSDIPTIYLLRLQPNILVFIKWASGKKKINLKSFGIFPL